MNATHINVYYVILYAALGVGAAFGIVVLADNYFTQRRTPKVSYRAKGSTSSLHDRVAARQADEEAVAALKRAEEALKDAPRR